MTAPYFERGDGMTHNIRIQKRYADAVVSGDKTFEVRYNDRRYKVGDTVKFSAVDDFGNPVPNEIETKTYRITYVLPDFYSVRKGWCVFSIREVSE